MGVPTCCVTNQLSLSWGEAERLNFMDIFSYYHLPWDSLGGFPDGAGSDPRTPWSQGRTIKNQDLSNEAMCSLCYIQARIGPRNS